MNRSRSVLLKLLKNSEMKSEVGHRKYIEFDVLRNNLH